MIQGLLTLVLFPALIAAAIANPEIAALLWEKWGKRGKLGLAFAALFIAYWWAMTAHKMLAPLWQSFFQ